MRVDIFRRKEKDESFSYLIVPEGRLIPAVAARVDWIINARGVELNLDQELWDEFSIDYPAKQIQANGYAVSASISGSIKLGSAPLSSNIFSISIFWFAIARPSNVVRYAEPLADKQSYTSFGSIFFNNSTALSASNLILQHIEFSSLIMLILKRLE